MRGEYYDNEDNGNAGYQATPQEIQNFARPSYPTQQLNPTDPSGGTVSSNPSVSDDR
jgi:hypothetical protein